MRSVHSDPSTQPSQINAIVVKHADLFINELSGHATEMVKNSPIYGTDHLMPRMQALYLLMFAMAAEIVTGQEVPGITKFCKDFTKGMT